MSLHCYTKGVYALNEIKLSKIIEIVGDDSISAFQDKKIFSLCFDSRKASPGSAFFCINGALADGHDYAISAYEKGCRIFLCEKMPRYFPIKDATVIMCKNGTRAALADVAAEFYMHPEKSLTLIGVTGTKGKTTIARLIASILNENGINTGYIGTNGVDFDGYHHETVNTTPESCDLYEYLYMMHKTGVNVAVIEVSSQALKNGRTRGLTFDTCVFSNLYHDHIGGVEHPTFENYKDCKKLLFKEHCGRFAVINADSAYSEEFSKELSVAVKKISYSVDKKADVYAKDVELCRSESGLGTRFTLPSAKAISVSLQLPGRFNVSNALAAVAVCRIYGVADEKIADSISKANISGRFEAIRINGADFIIDYAHNGESLRSVLSVLRSYDPERLICLFGSVGGRTQMRRAELGQAAFELADISILTSDNPDCESPEAIIEEIALQYKDPSRYITIPDRREAIIYAVKTAKAGDIVLLAGKGHEKYQLICGKRIPFSEREVLDEAIALISV